MLGREVVEGEGVIVEGGAALGMVVDIAGRVGGGTVTRVARGSFARESRKYYVTASGLVSMQSALLAMRESDSCSCIEKNRTAE